MTGVWTRLNESGAGSVFDGPRCLEVLTLYSLETWIEQVLFSIQLNENYI